MLVLNTFDILVVSQALVKKNLVCLPTDTLYALCADAYSDEAVRKVFVAKARKFNKALPIFVSSLEQALEIGDFNEEAMTLAQSFWPGPLTIVVPLHEHSKVSSLVVAGQRSVAIRMPANGQLIKFLKVFGNPITATSANLSETMDSNDESEIIKNIGSYIEIFIKSDETLGLIPSTIVSCINDGSIEVTREGAISAEKVKWRLSLTGN